MTTEKITNQLQDLKIKPGQIHKLKTIKRATNSDWSDQTQHKNPEYMCLKFLTSLAPSVEKIMNLLQVQVSL